jgi:hypothetical protein
MCCYVLSEEDMEVVSQEDQQATAAVRVASKGLRVRRIGFQDKPQKKGSNTLSKSFCAATYFPPNGRVSVTGVSQAAQPAYWKCLLGKVICNML